MMNMLQDKVILITGCLGTLGRSAVDMFLKRGAIVYGCDFLPVEQFSDYQQLQELYGDRRFVYKQTNMFEESEVRALIEDVERCFGRLDGTYHNVYSNGWKPIVEMSLEEWEYGIKGTLTSTFLLNKYAIQLLIRCGGGSIVNTSSILSQVVSDGYTAYAAAKAGVNQLTRVIAADYAAFGIRANVIMPGNFRSKASLTQESERERETIKRKTWLGRTADADEINEAAAFLLSDASSYVTGSLYQVDGGFH